MGDLLLDALLPVAVFFDVDDFSHTPLSKIECERLTAIPKLFPEDIKKVWFNRNKEGQMCTTVLWSDDTKTTVRCLPEDKEDKEKALAMCISKRVLGNKGNFNEVFKKYCFADEN